MVAPQPLDPSGSRTEAADEHAVRAEPAGDESVSVEREFGSTVELHLRESDAAVSAKLDRPTPMATAGTVPETGADAAGSPGRHSELLPDKSPAGRGRGGERKHQN